MKRSWNSRSISTVERLCFCAGWVGWIGSVVVSAIGALPRNAFRPPHRQGTGAILRPARHEERSRVRLPREVPARRAQRQAASVGTSSRSSLSAATAIPALRRASSSRVIESRIAESATSS